MSTTILRRSRGVPNWALIALLAASGGLASCATAVEGAAEGEGEGEGESARPARPSWEEFRQRAERVVDGATIYVVEGDLGFTVDELYQYYVEHVASPGGLGRSQQKSTVNRVNGADDLWAHDGQLRLTYCVSNSFGTNKARAVSEMAQATAAWERAANVNFRYLPPHDGACSNANTNVSFSVRPSTSGGACAFFPSGGGCVPRTLIIDFNDFDTNPFWPANAPNVDTVGVFRHELGHILGLRHEHTRPDSGVCQEDANWRAVTGYDQASVMHYPYCNGVHTADFSITPLDEQGARLLYPTNLSNVRDLDEKADLNNDGRADVCGRGVNGIVCALGTGSTFGTAGTSFPSFSDVNGWGAGPEYYSTIRLPDLNNDGRADACGRGFEGIFCEINGGPGSPIFMTSAFADADGWNAGPEYYSTIRFPDLNGDGRADVCGRGTGGLVCALGTGSSFGAATTWSAAFSDANGWVAGPEYYATIRFPDLNNDGRADVCGRGTGGVVCALSTGTGFGAATTWSAAFSDANGWKADPAFYSTVRFPDLNNDGRADVCGRGVGGLVCALNTGTGFGAATTWSAAFSDANGWATGPQFYSTIAFEDLNNDGRADVCGRGTGGLVCALSTGTGFGAATTWSAAFSDVNGWSGGPQYYSTLRLRDANGDGRADVCGRGFEGIFCALSTGTGFGAAGLWSAAFSDADGWASSPKYYTTIRFP